MIHGMTDYKDKSSAQEALVKLYLRLNGYFTTGFIIHSNEKGKIAAEIDALAVRLPYQKEPERKMEPSPFLAPVSGITDLLICEVKSRGKSLRFNESFRDSLKAIQTVLRWSGLFKDSEVRNLSRKLQPGLNPAGQPKDNFFTVNGPRATRIRPLLCSPERQNKQNNQVWFLHGNEIFKYIWKCLCPETQRDSCATQYDFTSWGKEFSLVVKYFKDRRDNGNPGQMRDLYTYLKL
jgi:hypothetical protein